MSQPPGSRDKSSPELDQNISDNIRRCCQLGYEHYDRADNKAALRHFYKAWTLLPKPQSQWQEAGWVLTAMGDCYFAKADFSNGIESLRSALHCPKAANNPFIHMRLGQCLFEAGQLQEARHHLQHALEHDGKSLLAQQDQKYLQLAEQSPVN